MSGDTERNDDKLNIDGIIQRLLECNRLIE